MSTFPSILSTISDPTATNRLNAPSHSSIEQAQNDGIKKLETFIGTLSSAVGTLMYDIRGAGSDGGGHVQGANKGGTGQTAFTKGDILVAQSSSVLSKLAVGANNNLLVADSAQDVGVKWSDTAVNRIVVNTTSIATVNTSAAVSVMSVNIPGSTLGTAGAIRARILIQNVQIVTQQAQNGTIDILASYGTASVQVLSMNTGRNSGWASALGSISGECVVDVISAGSVASQKMILKMNAMVRAADVNASFTERYTSVIAVYVSSIMTQESSSTLALNVRFLNNQQSSTLGVTTDGYIVEKI